MNGRGGGRRATISEKAPTRGGWRPGAGAARAPKRWRERRADSGIADGRSCRRIAFLLGRPGTALYVVCTLHRGMEADAGAARRPETGIAMWARWRYPARWAVHAAVARSATGYLQGTGMVEAHGCCPGSPSRTGRASASLRAFVAGVVVSMARSRGLTTGWFGQ